MKKFQENIQKNSKYKSFSVILNSLLIYIMEGIHLIIEEIHPIIKENHPIVMEIHLIAEEIRLIIKEIHLIIVDSHPLAITHLLTSAFIKAYPLAFVKVNPSS
mmetsp:Transcript_110924/g.166115  ORF Transcript_110924/g.166115 Transcript_110924/m.166115 type:complete len:103 (+) Transcript_110924:45-353(+)